MKIVIAGAGSVGRSVALELLDHGHECTLIDNQPDKLRVACGLSEAAQKLSSSSKASLSGTAW